MQCDRFTFCGSEATVELMQIYTKRSNPRKGYLRKLHYCDECYQLMHSKGVWVHDKPIEHVEPPKKIEPPLPPVPKKR